MEREVMEYDLLIVGAGPAGLAAAIRAKQVAGPGLGGRNLDLASMRAKHGFDGLGVRTGVEAG